MREKETAEGGIQVMKRLLGACALMGLIAGPALAEDVLPESRWGADDRLGAINLITPEKTAAAAKLVTQGKTYPLGVITGRATPAFGHRTSEMYMYPHGNGDGAAWGENKATANDDFMTTWLGVGSQIDGFAHFGVEHVYFNNVELKDIFNPRGAQVYGTHSIPPIATRGVLIDMAQYLGVDMVAMGTVFTKPQVQDALQKQGVEVQEGDVVLFHTGWQKLATEDPKRFILGEPGPGVGAARWLVEQGVVAVGADTWGLEPIPHEDKSKVFPVHELLLARSGVYILENMETKDLAADEAYEFFFVLGVPRFEGAVQMVINPVAMR
jgi:kynurenine formamidase